ncbi:hypothetical protein M758_8G033200 [Ceratodon purpureus]|nr:hypothetical protein M758_8G033200 [Ceratodon purpureus]
MSLLLQKALDRVERTGWSLEDTEEGSSGSSGTSGSDDTTEAVKGGMDGNDPDLQFGHQEQDQGEGPGRRQRNKDALQRLNADDAIKSLILSQIREASVLDVVDGQLMDLLQKCLDTDGRRSSIVALSGYIEHFESRLEEDLGWGCGWRNIQMLSSYMLAQNPEVRDVLFGGAGFVPDIPAMQQWLEIAWLKGFDVLGADYFDWKITGTHKWIGTTECAALLRSFGIRARIIDFRTASSKRGMDGMRGKGGSDTEKGSDPGASDELSGNFGRMTVSDQSSDLPSADNLSPEHNTPEVAPVVVADEREELHYLRPCPENPNLCATCVEERNNCGFSHRLHSSPHKGVIHNGDSRNITGEQRNDDFTAGGGGGVYPTDVDLNHKYMTNWIWNYFSAESGPGDQQSITFSNRSPLYFQHRGHSRTIVGIERCKKEGSNKEEDYLIVLDPSQRTLDIIRSLQRKQGWEELVKRGMHSLNQAEYQLCYIEPGIAMGEELESLKTLSSVRYMY